MEYKLRIADMEDFLIDTGLPATVVNNKMLRKAYRRMDPRFVIPGEDLI